MAKLIAAPFRLAGAIPVAVTETVINIVDRTPNDETPLGTDEQNLYELVKPQFNLSCLIYFYTELRSATKDLLKSFAESKKIKYEVGRNPSELEILYNAISHVDSCLENLETATNPPAALAKYKTSLIELGNLQSRFDLSSGDIEIFKRYFKIISKKPKYNTEIKSDIRLYSDYINPLFIVGFGGTEFNIQRVENMVKRDSSSYLYYIDDDFTDTSLDVKGFVNGFKSEAVYAIYICDLSKAITVVFRGSVNANDWITNIQANTTECKFPGFTTEKGMKSIERKSFGRVHEGFYKYLFGKTNGRNGSTKSKGEEIMGKLMSLLKKEKKGYKISFTGHSLGGALSTLMSARAAALGEIDSTIINVSFASPFVGDQTFRESFYEWEKTKRLKHLRVSNYEDVVPLIPICTYPGRNFHRYRHTGIHVKLYDKSLLHPFHYHLSYPKEGSLAIALRNTLHSNIFNGLNINITNHLPTVYSRRLENAETDLKQLNLQRLYSDSDLTGWQYAEAPAPELMISTKESSPEKAGEENDCM